MALLHEHTVRVLHHSTPTTVSDFLNVMDAEGWTFLGQLDIPGERDLSLIFRRINPDYWSDDA